MSKTSVCWEKCYQIKKENVGRIDQCYRVQCYCALQLEWSPIHRNAPLSLKTMGSAQTQQITFPTKLHHHAKGGSMAACLLVVKNKRKQFYLFAKLTKIGNV